MQTTTVFDTLYDHAGNPLNTAGLVFRPSDGRPGAGVGTGVVSGDDISLYTSALGTFTVNLQPGVYYVWIGNSAKPRPITVPTSPSVVALHDLFNAAEVAAGYAFWGKTTLASLGQSDVLALAESESTSAFAGAYAFAAGAGYCFFAWPEAFGAPAVGSGFALGSFPMSMAAAGDGYAGTVVNGWTAQVVSVGGVNYYVFRSQNQLGGAFSVTVQ